MMFCALRQHVRRVATIIGVAMLFIAASARGDILNLSDAIVVIPADQSPLEKQAVRVLIEEVEKRTQIRWQTTAKEPDTGAAIYVGKQASLADFSIPMPRGLDTTPEGFRLLAERDGNREQLIVAGNDDRGVLFGVGRLLREMRMKPQQITAPDDLNVKAAPQYPIRGHQLGYRPKTNSYDAWTVPMWDQYIRELAIFGNNAVELIPPRSDDAPTSPHFPLPQMEMMVEMSRICDEYDMDVWIWYPAMDKDYSDPKTVEFALREWEAVFEKLPRVDAIFVPGGDPGHTHPTHLMALLEKQTAVLKKHHPNAQMWMSPQSFNAEWMQVFYDIMKQEPDWLTGLVYGPQVRVTLPELRAAIPERYPIRRYPDITHVTHCQYPVHNWDVAFAVTLGREVVNPRPHAMRDIFRIWEKESAGFITYSEGCNDDVNKMIWSVLGWDSDTPIAEILRQYGRFFFGPDWDDDIAQGLYALESNWNGPLLTNEGVYTTLAQFQQLEQLASKEQLANWRFQQLLYRAYYDAYVRARLIHESAIEAEALQQLRDQSKNAGTAMKEAEKTLSRAENPPAQAWRQRVVELADELYKSIRMQLSVEKYKAIAVGRGASLDTLDVPLNNRAWLLERFKEIRQLSNEKERANAIREVANWTDPGPGGFYDDLGNPTDSPRLQNLGGIPNDPAYYRGALTGFAVRFIDYQKRRTSQWTIAESLYDSPLTMEYQNLDPAAKYQVRITYGDNLKTVNTRLVANDQFEIHSFDVPQSNPLRPIAFDIPHEATKSGTLKLTWHGPSGVGGNGRQSHVAEVWLVKRRDTK